ncbi:SDR family NAD(P)-dependent oxidoreductase [Minwuia thermotolerans]|uniref:Short-chain dehydrogenase n=1 Tax=Minwuia thermotolerans TaxID=2056226 RepID=A0A2M9G517_9PROT|nr:SDR family NAD(P)-dependent oxidoreductase [Minwuia thermotolerans]PJK30819.1 short-chain dehydrogenase [Minwuia thermotolerans]
MSAPVALITGVGPGTGAAVARRFAAGGYRVAMLARTAERLEALADELPGARAFACNVSKADELAAAIGEVRQAMGDPSVVVHNAVRGTFAEGVLDTRPDDLERNFRTNTLSLLHLAQLLAPSMIDAGGGAFVITGNTAAHRGTPRFAGFAPTKAAQRVLAQAMARDLGPKGVHVAYVTIDAMIDLAWTRAGPGRDKPDEFFIKPAAIAEEIWHVAHQDRSAWSFDVEIRPFGETW